MFMYDNLIKMINNLFKIQLFCGNTGVQRHHGQARGPKPPPTDGNIPIFQNGNQTVIVSDCWGNDLIISAIFI